MTQCPHCGETSFYPQGPHSGRPCPLKKAEIDQRMRHAEVEHQARLEAIRNQSPRPPAPDPTRCTQCGKQFSHGMSGCVSSLGGGFQHFPNCPPDSEEP